MNLGTAQMYFFSALDSITTMEPELQGNTLTASNRLGNLLEAVIHSQIRYASKFLVKSYNSQDDYEEWIPIS